MIHKILTPTDAEAFQAIRLRGLKECPEAFASSYEEEIDNPISKVQSRLETNEQSVIFGAFESARLVAVVGLARETMRKYSHKAFVWGMYVAPEARRAGTGASILQFTLAHAADKMKVRQVNLGANTKNIAAVALYKKLGFEHYGIERDFMFVDGVFHDEYQMVWRAPSAV